MKVLRQCPKKNFNYFYHSLLSIYKLFRHKLLLVINLDPRTATEINIFNF